MKIFEQRIQGKAGMQVEVSVDSGNPDVLLIAGTTFQIEIVRQMIPVLETAVFKAEVMMNGIEMAKRAELVKEAPG